MKSFEVNYLLNIIFQGSRQNPLKAGYPTLHSGPLLTNCFLFLSGFLFSFVKLKPGLFSSIYDTGGHKAPLPAIMSINRKGTKNTPACHLLTVTTEEDVLIKKLLDKPRKRGYKTWWHRRTKDGKNAKQQDFIFLNLKAKLIYCISCLKTKDAYAFLSQPCSTSQ